MDVTFTNVLEGARQYFQGLPAATGSAASPASSTVSYGSAGAASMVGTAMSSSGTTMSVSNVLASTASGTGASMPERSNEHIMYQCPPEQLPSASNPPVSHAMHSYHYAQSQSAASQSYQFPQYSSHYSPSTHRPLNTHHVAQSPSRPPSLPHEQMTPSPKAQSYHQLQPTRHQTPSSHAQNAYMNSYQQAKSYYPPQSQSSLPPSSGHSYPPSASSQAYMPNHQFTSHSYSPHSHSPVQTQTQYLSTKSSQHYDNTNNSKSEHLTTSQHHRTTHNLPPIAALSSVNYHSNKSNRETVRLTNHRHRTQSTGHMSGAPTATSATVTTPSVGTSTSQQQQQISRVPSQYTQSSSNHYDLNSNTSVSHNTSVAETSSSSNGPTYLYPPTSSQAYTCTTTSTVSFSTTTSSTASVYNQSSYPQHFQKLTKTTYQESNQNQSQYQSSSSKDYHYQSTSNSNRTNTEHISVNNVNQQPRPENHAAPTVLSARQKRESPLDLSVKTVRTSADSTALDDAEIHSSDAHRNNKTFMPPNRSMPPPMQVPSNVPYVSYDHNVNNHQRNSNIRTTAVMTSGAPKVDFLPNFNASLQHPQRNQTVENNRQIVQQPHNDKNHNMNPVPDNNQNKYSRSMAYTNKVYYQQQQQNSYHPTASYPHSYNNNAMPNATHHNVYSAAQTPQKRSTEVLPRIDFPTPGHNTKTATMYTNSVRETQRKRPAELVSNIPNKIPKMDSWRQTIDQQIEQKLSSYTNSRINIEQQHMPTQQPAQQLQSHISHSSHQQLQHPQQASQHQSQQHQHLHQQKQQNVINNVPKQTANGNMVLNHHRSRNMYPTYSQNHSSYPQAQQPFSNNQYQLQPSTHNQTYVPTAMGQHHYPTHANMPNHSQSQNVYQQNVLPRANSNPKLTTTSPVRNSNFGGADKRVLSILRNSLEIKGANKEAQKKLEQVQVKPLEIHANHMRSSGVQQPSTDVTAPLQPKPGIIGRHNVSPFPAANLLERNSNTPPIYKFHFPRAVDSVRFESETNTKDNSIQTVDKYLGKQNIYTTDETISSQNNSNVPPAVVNSGTSDLDGLAAFLAARIRTKGELKQVGINQIQNIACNAAQLEIDKHIIDAAAPVATNTGSTSNINPPKLMKERVPRRRLFSRSEEESNAAPSNNISNTCAQARDSALRSSSETSVFDFRDSDSEGEMPVLERQSLDDMRRDRKSMNKSQQLPTISNENDVFKIDENAVEIKIEDTSDPFWTETCDKFLEQLKSSGGKKRGRRKKVVEPDVLAKLETVTKEKPIDNIILDTVVKIENIDAVQNQGAGSSIQIKSKSEVKSVKLENDDSDSDVPLIRRKPLKSEKSLSDGEDSNLETKKEKIGAKIKIEYSSDSSDSDSETIQSVSEKIRLRKMKERKENALQSDNEKGMVLRSADSSPCKKVTSVIKKKAIFGDGSDFHPGWEEEVYKYKKSLRMPPRLINITRAPHWHRMSTSLPDLDPCSPAPSSLTDDTEFSLNQRRSMPNNFIDSISTGKFKRDLLDSDMDSNSSFTFNYQKSYDSEEASCSSLKSTSIKKTEEKLKNKENNNILDVLVERCSKYKRKKMKGKDQKLGPKLIPKASNSLELLPTPSLGIGSPEKGTAKVNKGKVKNKEEIKAEMNNSVYLGFFRKETVNNFRDTFKKNSGFMGMGEPFSTVVLKSRTRTETRVLKQRATIREVFGEERPASAPPIACRDDDNMDSSQDSVIEIKKCDTKPQIQASTKSKQKENNVSPIRTGLRSASGRRQKIIITKKLQRGRKKGSTLLKTLTTKKINSDLPGEQNTIKSETPSIKSETPSIKSETPSMDGEDGIEVTVLPTKKRLKLRNMRRKFSSGFDYIRKKKKQVKKEPGDTDGTVKTKRRGILPRPSPESVQDIQREIKTWVMNKGVGETHLHRAARLGYTDVTAYCLEKMDCMPSPKDNAGYTPLHEACSRGHLDIARLLLQYGANVSESAQGGIRPLHEAAENGFVEILRLLLSYGADPMLATYSGYTPLSLATNEEARSLLKHYMADIQGLPAPYWCFMGPAVCFDPENSGYDPLIGAPSPDPIPEDEDIEIEMSDQQLPNLYTLRNEPSGDRWVLLQDLSVILKIKSRDTLLRQINGSPASTSLTNANKNIIKELKFSDFMEQAHCCQLLCANEKLNVRSSKIALVKYTDKVKQLLGVERVLVTTR